MTNNHTGIPFQAIFSGTPQLPFCDGYKLAENCPREFILDIDSNSLSDYMCPVL